ncbi:MAG: hypothetical protein RSB55_10145, partial [Oscillospiraceae bacterium]
MATNYYDIQPDVLVHLSDNTTPAYTVRISAPHPHASVADTIKLYAYAYIIVNPVPVTVTLTPPTSLYA